MKKLSLAELNRPTVDEYRKTTKIPLIVILDNIRSMNNIGSLFRTADAFAVEKLYLCGITATPPNKEIHKTALGATESVEWEYREDVVVLVNELKEAGIGIYLIEQTDFSVMIDRYELEESEKIAIILGNEVFGVSDELLPLADGALEIPQFGTKHSLNVSVAGGIVIWEMCKKIFKKKG